MGFVPPLNLGGFQPSPATLAQWVYQIWQYLQENPIATQEQIQEFIGTFITTSPTVQEMIGEGVDNYLVDNPPAAPVQSVQSKTGAVVLSYPDIVPASNAVPVYRAASVPSVNTLVGQYNLGYRLFVNTATQEIYTITPAGALSLVGRGKFDGTTIDVNTAVGDTTIAEALAALETWKNDTVDPAITDMKYHAGDSVDLQNAILFGAAEMPTRARFSVTSDKPFDGAKPVIRAGQTITGKVRCGGTLYENFSTASGDNIAVSAYNGVAGTVEFLVNFSTTFTRDNVAAFSVLSHFYIDFEAET